MKKKIVIWTRGYSPFIMGGDVNAPIGCEVEVEKPVFLGKGFRGYEIKSPDGRVTVIAEATTGAIVGNSLVMVKTDVANGPIDFMQRQLTEALAKVKTVRVVSVDEFWSRYPRKK